MRILLIGATGQLGWELVGALAPLGEVFAPGRARIDLEHADSVRDVMRSVRPDLVVNAAAYTAVDLAESDASRAQAINGVAPGVLAEEARRAGSLLVHFSTDYVFDGEASAPYGELDRTNPLCVYGRTKLAGEEAIRAVGCRHLILRTSWLYAARGHNFLRTMLRAGATRDEIRVVDDQRGAPTWTRHVAAVTGMLLQRACTGSLSDAALYHVTAGGHGSWRDFAEAVLHGWYGANAPRVVPVRTDEYPTAARRPAWSVLSNRSLAADTGISLPDWRSPLEFVLGEVRTLADSSGWVRSGGAGHSGQGDAPAGHAGVPTAHTVGTANQ